MTPSQETCRRLTLYFGRQWHEIKILPDRIKCSCGEIFYLREADYAERHCFLSRSSFTTTDDLFAVFGKMVERGEWKPFIAWLVENGHTGDKKEYFGQSGLNVEYFLYPHGISWLFCLNAPDQIGERMEMVNEWLKERGK